MSQPIYKPVPNGEILNSNGLFIEAGQSGGWLLRFGKGGPSIWFPDAVRLCEAIEAPKADWSQAPEWAMWWAVDAEGQSWWYESEPGLGDIGWVGERWTAAEWIDIPIGIDWRLLKERRPQEAAEGKVSEP